MVKHTQTIRQQQPTNCLRVFDHFVWLALEELSCDYVEPWIYVVNLAASNASPFFLSKEFNKPKKPYQFMCSKLKLIPRVLDHLITTISNIDFLKIVISYSVIS